MEDINIRGLIAIQNHGGSGSLLLQSLLDDHPEIISLPALYTRELIRFWFEMLELKCQHDLVAFVRAFVNSSYHAYWFNPDPMRFLAVKDHGLVTMGDNRNENIAIDRNTFMANLHRQLSKKELNIINFIEAVYIAYAKTVEYKHAKNCWLLFPFHRNPPEYVKLLSEGMKKIKFIHTVREPIQSIASGIRFESKTMHGRSDHYWYEWFIHPNPGAMPLSEAENVETCAIRFEDMHEKSEQTMRAIAKWLDIEWNNCLLQSTFAGKKWWNRAGSTPINGVNPSFTKFNGHDVVPWFDKFRLEFLCAAWKEKWNYKIPFYVNNPFFEFIARVCMIFPFKIDFIPLKVPSHINKMNYFKLLFTDMEQSDQNSPKHLQNNKKKAMLTIAINNFLQSTRAIVKNYSVNYGTRKKILAQRKYKHQLVQLLPLE